MDESDDPYNVLGVSRNASAAQIRAAYRKLALRHHPDKQSTPEAKEEAHTMFARISHAYELLSDDNARRDYEFSRQQQQQQQQQQQYSNFYEPHFHDPFQVFAQVFGQEFGIPQRQYQQEQGAHQDTFQRDPFMNDPFFGGNMFGGSFFGGGGGMFGGGSMFSNMQRQMDMMREQQDTIFRQSQQQMQQGMYNGPSLGINGQHFSSYSSSSSSFGRGSGGTRESVTTTTRMVNGRRQTVTERTITNPDGTVERHVETSGDEDFPQLNGGGSRQDSRGRLRYDHGSSGRQLEGDWSGPENHPQSRY